MATYLVTGAAGFIGSNLVRALLAEGHAVRGIDDLSTGRRENLAGLDALDFVEADINDAAALGPLMRGTDYVLHQAAIPSVPRSVRDPVATHRACATGTLAVLEAARAASIRRLVYASSSSAYGESEELPKVESMPTRPLSPYAVAKLAGEHYCLAYAHVHGLPTVCLRYFNVFGPWQDPAGAYAAVIPRFVTAVAAGESPTIFGDGRQTRDFTYIENAVEANLKACLAEGAVGHVFNVACGVQTTLLELVELIGRVLGKPASPQHLPPRPGDIRHSLGDISQARSILGYTAAVSLEEGLRRYVAWWRGGGTS